MPIAPHNNVSRDAIPQYGLYLSVATVDGGPYGRARTRMACKAALQSTVSGSVVMCYSGKP